MNQEKIKCLVIDDDLFIQDLMEDKLKRHFPEMELLAMASSGTEGLELIKTHQPDLVFLDVEMSDMTGFEMLARLEEIRFQTIFITTYSHYAIEAIRFNALDYLVKPIKLNELKEAVKRYKNNLEKFKLFDRVQQALINLNTKDIADQTLVLQTHEKELRMTIKDITYVEAARNYSYIHLTNNKKSLCSKTLSDLEEILKGKGFFRCHKSLMVNRVHITSYEKSNIIVLSDGKEIPISRRKKEAFKAWYEV
ncbi:MAG: LytTR family DNA-binding domain-containing protein [Saprospiraceae bacterium]|jgi:two-component system LytT family response regulator|nr:LytTR family DNA-binding domain-containing protein [Saprospiraceae bacterium]